MKTRVEVRWRDLDMLGHLNQSVYHEFLEEARAAFFQQARGGEWEAFVLARVELDYKREVRRDDGHVEIVVRVERVGRSSVTVGHDVLLPDGTLAATGRSVLVGWDPRERRSRPFGDEERARLNEALGAAPA